MTSNDSTSLEATQIFKAIPDLTPSPEAKHQVDGYVYWNEDLENTVQTLGEYSQGYKIMHIEAAQQNVKWYNMFMFASIFLGSTAGVLSGVGMTLNKDAPITFPLISSIVSFLAGLCSAVVKFSNFDEAASAHKVAASRYTSLEHNVRRQLALPRENRAASMAYVTWLNSAYDDLFLGCPLISPDVATHYRSQAEKNGVRIPMNQCQSIIINKHNQKEQSEHNTNDQGTTKTKSNSSENARSENALTHTDCNRFDNGMMQYELGRFLETAEHI